MVQQRDATRGRHRWRPGAACHPPSGPERLHRRSSLSQSVEARPPRFLAAARHQQSRRRLSCQASWNLIISLLSIVDTVGNRSQRVLSVISVEPLVLHGCVGPQSLAGKSVSRVSLRDPSLNPCLVPVAFSPNFSVVFASLAVVELGRTKTRWQTPQTTQARSLAYQFGHSCVQRGPGPLLGK